jgi:hypothetical protein
MKFKIKIIKKTRQLPIGFWDIDNKKLSSTPIIIDVSSNKIKELFKDSISEIKKKYSDVRIELYHQKEIGELLVVETN